MVLGFAMGRMRFVSTAEASTLNRIAFLILQPALIFPLVNGVDLGSFYFDAIALYALAQVVVFLTTLLLSIYLFKCCVSGGLAFGHGHHFCQFLAVYLADFGADLWKWWQYSRSWQRWFGTPL